MMPGFIRGYSQQVVDHYYEPRNLGRFATAANVGTGWAGSPELGGVIRLQVRVDASGIIEDTRFKAYGCGSTIAAASWVSESLKGKSLQQALDLHGSDIVHALALPPVKTFCSILAQDAIHAAVNDYRRKQE